MKHLIHPAKTVDKFKIGFVVIEKCDLTTTKISVLSRFAANWKQPVTSFPARMRTLSGANAWKMLKFVAQYSFRENSKQRILCRWRRRRRRWTTTTALSAYQSDTQTLQDMTKFYLKCRPKRKASASGKLCDRKRSKSHKWAFPWTLRDNLYTPLPPLFFTKMAAALRCSICHL